MDEYTGFVLGGSKSGKWFTHPAPFFEEYEPVDFDLDEDISVETKVRRFKHEKFHFMNNETGEERMRGFWVPVHVEMPHVYILDELMRGYESE